MKENDRFIVLPRGQRPLLKEKFKSSESQISVALHFEQNSEKCRRIRSAAVNLFKGIPFI